MLIPFKEIGAFSSNNMLKKYLITLVVILSSCSVLDTNRVASGYVAAFKAIDNALFGYDDFDIDRELVKNIPYASSLVKIGNGPKGLMILESIINKEETWVSADGLYIVIKAGRIIKTSGFANNLTNFQFQSKFQEVGDDVSINQLYYYSYDKPELNNLPIKVSLLKRTTEKVTILDEEKTLTLYEEELSNDYLGWKVVNKFWLDKEFFVWKSEQFISPKLPKILIEVTKKPS